MKTPVISVLILVLVSNVLWQPAGAKPEAVEGVDYRKSEEFRIGKMVMEIARALKAPEDPQSLKTIVRHGQDSRYYVMIRGWLVQELQGVESQVGAARGKAPKKLVALQKLLKKAIRGIDLE